jgi:hypothetical protein
MLAIMIMHTTPRLRCRHRSLPACGGDAVILGADDAIIGASLDGFSLDRKIRRRLTGTMRHERRPRLCGTTLNSRIQEPAGLREGTDSGNRPMSAGLHATLMPQSSVTPIV